MLAAPAPALAWGASGHRIISTLAAETLPDEIPGFLRTPDAAWQIGELGREADRSKGAGQPHDHDLDPGHYVDIGDDQTIAGVPVAHLPPTREAYDTALRAKGLDEYRVGYLPYSIMDGWEQLRIDFAYWRVDRAAEKSAKTTEDHAWFGRDRHLREMLTLRDLGYWSHFVGDASQPLHASIHYNGWGDFPNPQGYSTSTKLHAYFEGEFVREHVTQEEVKAKLQPYRDCHCSIQQRTEQYLLAMQAQVVPLYELDKRGAFRGSDSKGVDFAAARLAAGASELRDMIVDAWRSSEDASVGYPPVKVRNVEAGKVVPLAELKGRD